MANAASRSTSWPAVAGAVGLHVAVAGLLLSGGLQKPNEIQPLVMRFDGPSPCVPLRLTSIASMPPCLAMLY